MAKYMLIMRATDESFAKFANIDFTEILEAMGKFNDELIRAGVLLAAEGLDDAKEGVVVDFTGETPWSPMARTGRRRNCSPATTSWTSHPNRKRSSGPSGRRSRRAARPRSAASPPSTSSRRTTSGSRRNAPGASRPGSSRRWNAGSNTDVSSNEARGAVEAVWRIESARIVGALARYTGDFALAEDLAQEALAEALVSWSVDGVPAEPIGWLLTTGRRRAIDAFRRRAALDERYACSPGTSPRRNRARMPCSTPKRSTTTYWR